MSAFQARARRQVKSYFLAAVLVGGPTSGVGVRQGGR
jgi:hypothetical protein